MSAPLPPVLVVDDERNMRLTIQSILGDEAYGVRLAESAEMALELLDKGEQFLVVVTDVRLGGMNGMEFLKRCRERWPNLPVLMITAHATPRLAVAAIQAGAFHYLPKPFEPEELLHALKRCAERYRLLMENARLRVRAGERIRLEQIIGESPKIRELRQFIQTVAPSNAAVLILGESGTGKELVAGAIHSLSARRHGPYVRINCAAITETLLESELFGHEKGAFTGAVRQKPGRVEEADGGTIFLDEIGDMSRPLQAKLLRFLEDGSFNRVGGTEELRVDVRLIAATNRDIVAAIKDNQFREDLFHRLNVVQFRPPPLRERGDDVLLLADHFLRHFSVAMKKPTPKLSAGAKAKLMSHHWPGNVRELRNVIERAVILETADEIQARSLPDFAVESGLRKGEAPAVAPPAEPMALDEHLARFERELIVGTLEACGGSVSRAAEQLKLSRHALRYRMQRHNLIAAGETDEEGPPDAR